jgi:hypothetical protein
MFRLGPQCGIFRHFMKWGPLESVQVTGGVPFLFLLFSFLSMRLAVLHYHALLPWCAASPQAQRNGSNCSWLEGSKLWVKTNLVSLYTSKLILSGICYRDRSLTQLKKKTLCGYVPACKEFPKEAFINYFCSGGKFDFLPTDVCYFNFVCVFVSRE